MAKDWADQQHTYGPLGAAYATIKSLLPDEAEALAAVWTGRVIVRAPVLRTT